MNHTIDEQIAEIEIQRFYWEIMEQSAHGMYRAAYQNRRELYESIKETLENVKGQT